MQNRLKDLREDKDLTQKDVAKLLNISQQYYQCYESGKNELPLRHCITLAKYYNVSIDYIVNIVSTKRPLYGTEEQKNIKTEKAVSKLEDANAKIEEAIKILLKI